MAGEIVCPSDAYASVRRFAAVLPRPRAISAMLHIAFSMA